MTPAPCYALPEGAGQRWGEPQRALPSYTQKILLLMAALYFRAAPRCALTGGATPNRRLE